jgi:membrane protein YqaA with SNARE-associated domain
MGRTSVSLTTAAMEFLTEPGLFSGYFANATSGYIGLFVAAFLAATLLPLGSEMILAALLLSGLSPSGLVLVATAGNVLGSCSNYWLGCYASQSLLQRWCGISEQSLVKARSIFQRYGLWSLCFAWLPVVGDPLTLLAGILKIRLLWFVLLVTSGKFLRYLLVAVTTLQIS